MTDFKVKLVTENEIDAVMDIIADAKALLKTVSTQWQQGYPYRETMLVDIKKHQLFGAYAADGTLAGVAAIIIGIEPDYLDIEGEGWQDKPSNYDVVLHRVAVKKEYYGQGIGKEIFRFAARYAKENGCHSVKGDTHAKNQPMQRIFAACGFSYRGVIYIKSEKEDNSRIAYELSVK